MQATHFLWQDGFVTQMPITLISSGADPRYVRPESFGATMGGELEGQLYREVDGELVPADLTQDLLDELNAERPGCFTPDLFGHMLEVVHSGPVTTLKAYASGMVESLLLLRHVLEVRGLHYIVDGLPPFATEPQINYDGPIGPYLREKIRHLFGPMGVQLWMVCGAHFHTGLPKGEGGLSDGDAALWLHRHMARPLDHLLRAVTNNAPFCLGRMTGYMSARGERRRVLNDSGVAQTLPLGFSEYINHLNKEKQDGMILGDRDHRTTLRPTKNSGTIEWTMCDNGRILTMLAVLELVRLAGQRLLAEFYSRGVLPPVQLFGTSDAHDTRHNAYHVDRFGLRAQVRLLGGERERVRVTDVLKILVDFADWDGRAQWDRTVPNFHAGDYLVQMIDSVRMAAPTGAPWGEVKHARFMEEHCVSYCGVLPPPSSNFTGRPQCLLDHWMTPNGLECTGFCHQQPSSAADIRHVIREITLEGEQWFWDDVAAMDRRIAADMTLRA